MKKKLIVAILLIGAAWSSAFAQDLAKRLREAMLRVSDPLLLIQAEERGLYDREAFPVLREVNPFYIRADFNGDGNQDLAFWVQNSETRERGVAIVHSTLDQLYIFGAGEPRPDPLSETSNQVFVDGWHLIPIGRIESHPYTDVPEIGVRSGEPFAFERETLEFVHFQKSAFVFYWAKGQYWEFWTAD